MSAVAVAVVGSAVIGGAVASSSANKAAKAQTQAAETAAAEQRAARDQITALLAPYTASGIPALQAQLNLLGLGTKTTNWEAYARSNPALMRAYEAQRTQPVVGFGAVGQPEARLLGFDGRGEPIYDTTETVQFGGTQMQPGGIQSLSEFAQRYYQDTGIGAGDDISQFIIDPQQQAINEIEQGAAFQALAQQGENAILQNASATGGLRGGNTQAALAQFRPALLNQFIEQQYGRLGGMVKIGQASAAGVGAAGQEAATNIGNALTNVGQAQAGAALAKGNAWNQALGTVGGFAASGGFGGFGSKGGSGMPSISDAASSVSSQLGGTYKPLPF